MQTSIFLARLIGPLLVLVAIGMLIDPGGYAALVAEFLKSPGLLYLGAGLGLVAGMALVLKHNVWEADWRVIITLLGWMTLIDSTSWLLVPQRAAAVWSPIVAAGWFIPLTGILVLLLGAVLGYFGYFASHDSERTA
jgi:hypothetical protein